MAKTKEKGQTTEHRQQRGESKEERQKIKEKITMNKDQRANEQATNEQSATNK